MPTDYTTRSVFGEVRGIDVEKRTVTGYASTGEIDRYGEIVLPSAFKDLDRFLKERHLFCAGHRYVDDAGMPTVIGKVLSAAPDAKGLKFTAWFDTDELGEAWFQKFRKGVIKAFSIGFIPKTFEYRELPDANGRMRQVRTYTDVELLEISAVPIPANRESLVAAGLGLSYEALELLDCGEDYAWTDAPVADDEVNLAAIDAADVLKG